MAEDLRNFRMVVAEGSSKECKRAPVEPFRFFEAALVRAKRGKMSERAGYVDAVGAGSGFEEAQRFQQQRLSALVVAHLPAEGTDAADVPRRFGVMVAVKFPCLLKCQ